MIGVVILDEELKMEAIDNKGGVTNDTNAVHCVFHRKSLKLDVVHGSSKVSVDCIKPVNDDESEEMGPTPLGNYLIDKKRQHKLGIDWFNLHQQFSDGTGYFGYGRGWVARKFRAFRRANFGLHPGEVSHGCVTVKKENWAAAVAILDKGDLTYDSKKKKGQKFAGYLIVKDD